MGLFPARGFFSWPGRDRGSQEWKECREWYGLDDTASPKTFHGSPLQKTGDLLRKKIPIILVAGGRDEAVPFEENGAILAEQYHNGGGDIRVIVKPECGHHPHSLEDPQPIVDFLISRRLNTKEE